MKDGIHFNQLSYPSWSLKFCLLSFCVYNVEQLQRKYIPPLKKKKKENTFLQWYTLVPKEAWIGTFWDVASTWKSLLASPPSNFSALRMINQEQETGTPLILWHQRNDILKTETWGVIHELCLSPQEKFFSIQKKNSWCLVDRNTTWVAICEALLATTWPVCLEQWDVPRVERP